MRRRATILLAVWAAGFSWLGCNALLGNESAVFEPDGGSADVVTGEGEGGPGESGSVDDGASDGAHDGPHDAAVSDVDHPCTVTTTDPFNCGVCGHDCLGGACTGGKCQPVILVNEVGSPAAIAVDATHVYWTNNASGDVRRVPIAGGATEIVFDGPPGMILGEGLVRSGSDLYFTIDDGNADGGVFRCPAGGCGAAGPDAVVAPLSSAEFVGLADGGVLLVSESFVGGRVGRCTLPCTGGLDVIAPSEGFPSFVAGEGDSYYWATLIPNGGNLRGKNDLISPPTDLVTGRFIRQVDIHGAEVLYADRGGGMRAISRDGGAVRQIFGQPTETDRFALDGEDVYFGDALSGGRVLRCNVTACGDAGAVIAGSQDHPYAIATDKTSIYWTNAGTSGAGGGVVRVAK